MSLFKRTLGDAASIIPRRLEMSSTGAVPVTNDTAMRHSGVWACLRLRANLISTMPVDAYREVNNISIELPKPPVLVNPGGEYVSMQEWLYSTQVDLDRAGNAFGLITERAGTGLPSRIDLMPIQECAVIMRKGKLYYRFGGKEYEPYQVWHEKQYTVSGLPFGLSPVAYAAWTIGEYLSLQQFATNWFSTGGMPKGQLKNSAKTMTSFQAEEHKARFKSNVMTGDVWVTGHDWEFIPMTSESAGNGWLDEKGFGVVDVARFFDCPADLIDAAVRGSSVTYANITQRNMQFLIMHLGPTIARREMALSGLLPKPRYVKLNTSALLRMDDQARAAIFKTKIDSRTMAPSEVREIEDQPPMTEAQVAEIERFWPAKQAPQPTKAI